jgi:hypothetical protein
MSINHINAGILHTQFRMAGLNLDEALKRAREVELQHDLRGQPLPHRATIIRLLRAMWAKADADSARVKKQLEDMEAFDARVSTAYPAEWAAALSLSGRDRREAKREIRRLYRQAQG